MHILLQSTPVSVNQTQCQQMANNVANKSSTSIYSPRFAGSMDDLKTRFKANCIYHVYDDGSSAVFASSTVNNIPVLLR